MRLCCRASDGPPLQAPGHTAPLAVALCRIQAWNLLKLFTYPHRQESTGGKRWKRQGTQNSRRAKIPESHKREGKKNECFQDGTTS